MAIEMGCKRSLTRFLRIGAGGLALSAGILLAGCASPNVRTQRPASGSLLPFTARGNEPGWILTLSEDAIALAYNYGGDRVTAPLPQLQSERDGFRYAAETVAGTLDAVLHPRVCRDSMSGMPYPWEVVVTLVRGCGGAPAALLVGTVWTVERVGERAVEADVDVTVEFGVDGRVQGSTGCNRFGGSFELSGENLTFSPLAATRRACPPPLMQLESEFLDVLQAVQRFDLDDTGALILEDAARRGMRARASVK